MAQIGTFTQGENGVLNGTIKTLTLNVKAAIRPSDKDNDKAPDYRVFAGSVEFGAAWRKTTRDDLRLAGRGREWRTAADLVPLTGLPRRPPRSQTGSRRSSRVLEKRD